MSFGLAQLQPGYTNSTVLHLKGSYNFSGADKPVNGKGLYGRRYSEFVVPLVKAVQKLNSENESLKSALEEVMHNRIVQADLEKIKTLLEK